MVAKLERCATFSIAIKSFILCLCSQAISVAYVMNTLPMSGDHFSKRDRSLGDFSQHFGLPGAILVNTALRESHTCLSFHRTTKVARDVRVLE